MVADDDIDFDLNDESLDGPEVDDSEEESKDGENQDGSKKEKEPPKDGAKDLFMKQQEANLKLTMAQVQFYEKAATACSVITGLGTLVPVWEAMLKSNTNETVKQLVETIGQKIEGRVTVGLRQTIFQLLVEVELIEPAALDQIREYERRRQQQSNPQNYVPPAPADPTGAEDNLDVPGDVVL